MRFSKEYKTFKEWSKSHKSDTSYNRRIRNAHKKYPKASLAQLRGHPKTKQKALSKLKKSRNELEDRYLKKSKKFKKLRDITKDKLEHAKQKNFPYYVFGLFIEEYEDEFYENQVLLVKRYYDHMYYSKGIKSKTDLFDFLFEEPYLYAYWIFNNKGREITLNGLLRKYGLTYRKAIKLIEAGEV